MAAIVLPVLTAQGRESLPVLSPPSDPPTNDDFVASIVFQNDLARAYGERDTRRILSNYSNTKIYLGRQKITKDDLLNGYTYAATMAAKFLGSKNGILLFVDPLNNNLQYNGRVNLTRKLHSLHQHGLGRPCKLPLLL